ncbi:DUF6207 family protein [Streptomyces sp. NPDC006285]|uniref:DUF6207 family protein n=1 Tax=Streptomyces sp. NPDC006285 TaxID=3364742 RepID=UPI0036925E0E
MLPTATDWGTKSSTGRFRGILINDVTAFAVQHLLAAHYALALADRTTRDLGEPGVRLRCFLGLHQRPDT